MKPKISKSELGSLSLYELNSGNSTALISPFGAQVISWKNEGRDILYSNPALITDKSKPLRAGAPVCFPWFNKGLNWSLGREIAPSHGPVRNSEWQLISETLSDDSASVAFSFEANSYLGLPLRISVRYTLRVNELKNEFVVTNLSDTSVNKFELALHSYFATSAPQETKISGLKDVADPFIPLLPIDQIFNNKGTHLSANFASYSLEIENLGFDKSVVWHPGLTHQLVDLPKDISPVPFLCLESLTDKIEVAANEEWKSSVTYSVR